MAKSHVSCCNKVVIPVTYASILKCGKSADTSVVRRRIH